jgi:CRISPR-associated protein Csd1
VPHVQRNSAIKPLLLADNAEYTFGLARETSDPEWAAKRHRAYLELLKQCAQQTGEPAVIAVLSFLRSDAIAKLDLPDNFDRSAPIIFRIEDEFPTEKPAVQQFWAAHHTPKGQDATPAMQCLVCGQEKPVLRRLHGRIKGIPGGQTSGTVLISANANAFESYGLEASHIAPTCTGCGDRFTKALNDLLRDESRHIILGEMAFIFWARQEIGLDFTGWLTDPNPKDVRDLISSVQSGHILLEIDDAAFYVVALSANGARAVVRDWTDTTVGQVKVSLARWFQRQRIVDGWGGEPQPLGIYALAGATVRDLRNTPIPTLRALLRAALTGTPLPWSLLHQAIRRNHAEREVTRPRATLIKLVLCSQPDAKERDMIQLQPDHPEPAYHCGRLLAVLEQIQRAAIGGNINTTIVDRFYGTASTAPASVFGRLIRGAQPHLSKLQRNRPGAAFALQEQLEEITAELPAFPPTLDLKEQGLFALGYYHQRAYDRAQARAARETVRRASTLVEAGG